MRVIIAGSRSLYISTKEIQDILKSIGWECSTVISGTARGIDICGEVYAADNNIPIERYPANWSLYGKRAGHIRNKEMANVADALLLIWDGESPGSRNMKRNMESLGKPIWEHIIRA